MDSVAAPEIAERLLATVGGTSWPDGLDTKDGVDRGVVLRGLRVAAAWLGDGTPSLATVIAGDGSTTATWELGSPAVATLRVGLDKDSGVLAAVEVSAAEQPSRTEAW